MKIKTKGLAEIQQKLAAMKRAAEKLHGKHLNDESQRDAIRGELKKVGFTEEAITEFFDALPKSGQLDDAMIERLTQHNTVDAFEAAIRKSNPVAPEAEIKAALDGFRRARKA